jgi:hypothetical protein
MLIEITFVNSYRGGRSYGTTKQFSSYSHARNFAKKWTFNEWYVRIDGDKPTAEQMKQLQYHNN